MGVARTIPKCLQLIAPTFARMDSPKRRPKERRRIPQARRLFSSPEPTQVAQAGPGWLREGWSEEENKALVEFILFHGANPSEWPTHPHTSKEAAKFVQQRSKAPNLRNSNKQ